MRKIILSLGLISFPAVAVTYEYPYLYKDPRAMGMGGAYVAVGGTASSVFYNPAGLSFIKKEAGIEVDIIKASIGVSKNTLDFINDLSDALDAEDGQYVSNDGDATDDQLYAVNEVLKAYQGKNLHLDITNFSSISKKGEKIGFALGFLASLKSDNRTHQGFGSDGVLETDSNVTAGGIFGLSYDFSVRDNRLSAGLSAKYMYRESLKHTFTSRELVENEDNLDNYITEELKKSGSAVGFDAGVIYSFSQNSFFRPSVGFSVLNIGDLDFKDAGKIPMTANVGIAVRPRIGFLKEWIFAADYVDLLNNYEEDSDIGKRIRIGAEVKVWDTALSTFALRVGSYQGYATAGVDLRLALLTLNFTTYAEEVGAYSGQDEDRRYLLGLYLGW
ncbi:type IX secretion system membrane protein PorP/SprF [Persephonella sp.]